MVNLRSLVARLRAEQNQLTRRLKKVTRIIDALAPLAGKTIRRKYRMSKAARLKISRAKKAYWKKRAAKKLKIAA